MKKPTIVLVAGARPNFIKIAPLQNALASSRKCNVILVHTGQHYDQKMSRVFFDELGIPRPDVNLEVGSGTHAIQTAKIMTAFDEFLEKRRPDLVVVVGDVNSTIACALASAKRGIRVAHVEAGLRSFDWTMPEEINRVVTDRLSDFLFCSEPAALKNLAKEGVAKKKIFLVGNVMIDTLLKQKKAAERSPIRSQLGLTDKRYALITLHRPSNVDHRKKLAALMGLFQEISVLGLPVIFPIHPRTKKNLEEWKISTAGLTLLDPLGYLDFLNLTSHATVVLTDSGGIQEETTILGVPCLTLRENTERPITLTQGTNQLVGSDTQKILKLVSQILRAKQGASRRPKLWDGKAAQRIAKILEKEVRKIGT